MLKPNMKVLDWFYAIRVCIKYKIIWNPFCKLDCGTYAWYKWENIFVVSANPFYEYFLETFMHEIGHHIAKRNGFVQRYEDYKKSVPKKDWVLLRDNPYMILLEEEAFASRFSRKTIGSRCNTKYLLECFYTYTAAGYRATRWVNSVELTDSVYKLTKRILG